MITTILALFKKRDVVYISLIVLLLCGGYFTVKYALSQRNEKSRYEHDYTTLKDGLKYYETKDGKVYGKSGVLELRRGELNDTIKKQIKNTGLKPRNVKTVVRDSIRIKDSLRLTLKDTLIYDSIRAEFGSYKDKWLELSFIKFNDSCDAIVTYDVNADIQQNIALIPRGWNIFKKEFWGPRHLEQTITSDNPHIRFPYAQVIEVKRK